jgi:hypothetical protein
MIRRRGRGRTIMGGRGGCRTTPPSEFLRPQALQSCVHKT